MSDDDALVMNIADDVAPIRGGRRGNPRARTVARTSKKGWRGGGTTTTTTRASDAPRDGGTKGPTRRGEKKRAREDAGGARARGGRGTSRGDDDARREGDGRRGKKPTRGAPTRDGRGTMRSREEEEENEKDDAFEVVRGDDGDGDDKDDDGLTFNPRDWASLMKRAAASGSGRDDDDAGENCGEHGDGEDAHRGGDRARVFGREPTTFEECGLPASMVKHLTENVGFGAPTAVQAKTIPRMLAGRDVLVRAETGSGKTLSYIAPLFSKIGGIVPRVTRNEGTRGLVLVPTRELATQVEDTARLVGRPFHWVVTSSIMGGENRAKEKARLRKGVCLLIATPGRLLDHLRMTESFVVDNLRWLVLDEADRLLDLGFEEDLNAILNEIGRRTEGASLCTALLSATLTPGTARLAERMTDPVTVVVEPERDDLEIVGDDDDHGDAADVDADANADALKRMVKIMTGGERVHMPQGLNHTVVEVSMKARLPALAGVLAGWMRGSISKVIVFFSSCESVEYHYKTLRWLAKGAKGKMEDDDDAVQGPYEIFRLHGLLRQSERADVFRGFATTKAGVLLCTDVGARGLDFVGVGATVQVDPPADATTYVHRVGRTARLGSNGEAVLFLQPKEREYADVLAAEGVSFAVGSAVAMLNVLDDAKDATERDKSTFKSMPHLHPAAQRMQKKLLAKVAADKPYDVLAKDAFRAHVRAYATFPSALKHIFHVKRLHLGHVAAAFGLKDAPQLIGASATKAALRAAKDAAAKKSKSDARRAKEKRVAARAKKLAPRAASARPIGGTNE